jgi:hypothetical protein
MNAAFLGTGLLGAGFGRDRNGGKDRFGAR